MRTAPRLSCCIATRNRAGYLDATLQTLLADAGDADIEVVVVDGNSTDGTRTVMSAIVARDPRVRYFRELKNSGLDGDYDKAVSYACGMYCWLMSDDDLVEAGAIGLVLAACEGDPTLVVANARVYDADFAATLQERRLDVTADRVYAPGEDEALFVAVVDYLSFIGGVIVRREEWLRRDRHSYYGSMFLHVGVLFQAPLPAGAIVLANPVVRIRYGNASWTARSFEIWMCKWPDLIWSFAHFTEASRASVVAKQPWRRPAILLLHRALGGYTPETYATVLRPRTPGWRSRVVANAVAHIPGRFAAKFVGWYVRRKHPDALTTLADLASGPFAD